MKPLTIALLAAAGIFSGITAAAQKPCNTTKTLNINTGIDAAGNKINYAYGVQDPFWTISAQTGSVPTGVSIGGQAYITTNSVMASSANSSLISYSPTGGDDYGGYITDPYDISFGAYSLTYRRTFRTCRPDSLYFYFDMAYDNYLVSITIDGTPIPGAVSPFTSAPGYYMWGNIFTDTRFLGSGSHTIEVRIGNEYATYMNPTSLNIIGSVNALTSSIVDNNSPEKCACTSSCNDTCYWKVTGNNILNGNNIFGTLTKDNIQIQTSAANRGIITSDGRFGWNEMSPTTLVHIVGDGRFNAPSDVRIENLPDGRGRILVVDDQGYVYKSDQYAKAAQEQQEMDEMKKEIALLKEQIASLLREKNLDRTPDAFIYPNPAKNNLDIQLMNAGDLKATSFVIADMQGKKILTVPLTATSDGNVMHVDISALAPGIYIGTVMANDQPVVHKKFNVQR